MSAYRVGLTGGIGVGKSTVAHLFQTMGVTVIDADDLSRALLAPGTGPYDRVIQHFGPEVMEKGHLDRGLLRHRVFSDVSEIEWLEALLHPLIFEEMERQADLAGSDYAILVVPLLLETGQRNRVDRLLVVDCPPAQQRERVMHREGMTLDLYEQIISAQYDRSQRRSAADDLIENEGNIQDLVDQVAILHDRYVTLAQHKL